MPVVTVPAVPSVFDVWYPTDWINPAPANPFLGHNVTFDLTGLSGAGTVNTVKFHQALVYHLRATYNYPYYTQLGVLVPPSGVAGSTMIYQEWPTDLFNGPGDYPIDKTSTSSANGIGLFITKIQSLLGTVVSGQTWVSPPNYGGSSGATYSVIELLIDYSPPPAPPDWSTVVVTQLIEHIPHTNKTMLVTKVRYPQGYVQGFDLSTRVGIVTGLYERLISVHGGGLAVISGYVLRVYTTGGTELAAGARCDGVDILSVGV